MKIERGEQAQHRYSHTYQTDAATRRWFHGLSIFLVAFFVVMTVLHLTGVIKPPPSTRDLLWMDIFPIVLAIWLCERANRRVLLSDDTIEVASWFSKRTLRRDEILGYGMGRLPKRVGGASYYIIVPRDGREMALPPFLNADRYFHSWVKALPKVEK